MLRARGIHRWLEQMQQARLLFMETSVGNGCAEAEISGRHHFLQSGYGAVTEMVSGNV